MTNNPPPSLLSSRTHDHLRTAFATEGQVHQLLLYFAQVAEIEQHADVAELLRSLAEAHALHAHGHLDLLRRAAEPLSGLPMGLTLRNLACAVAAQQQSAREMYPDMIRTAEAEGFLDIADWLRTLARVTDSHTERLRRAAEQIERIERESAR